MRERYKTQARRGDRVIYLNSLGWIYHGHLTGRARTNPRTGGAHLKVRCDDGNGVGLPPDWLFDEDTKRRIATKPDRFDSLGRFR